MAKNKTAYLVLLGSIQDTSALIPAGELFTPATTEFAEELLDAGIIGQVPPSTAKEKAAQAKAAAAAEAKEQAEADAAAAGNTGAGDEGDGEDHDGNDGSTADDDATE